MSITDQPTRRKEKKGGKRAKKGGNEMTSLAGMPDLGVSTTKDNHGIGDDYSDDNGSGAENAGDQHDDRLETSFDAELGAMFGMSITDQPTRRKEKKGGKRAKKGGNGSALSSLADIPDLVGGGHQVRHGDQGETTEASDYNNNSQKKKRKKKKKKKNSKIKKEV